MERVPSETDHSRPILLEFTTIANSTTAYHRWNAPA
jgi:hypothetical protein